MHESTPYSQNPAEFSLTSDAETLAAAHRLVDAYLTYLREHDTGGGASDNLLDAHDLPAAKDAIINAFRVVIATESRSAVRGLMVQAGMTLALFQENMDAILAPRQAPSRQGERSSSRPGIAKADDLAQVMRRVGEERAHLAAIFRQAAGMAEERRGVSH